MLIICLWILPKQNSQVILLDINHIKIHDFICNGINCTCKRKKESSDVIIYLGIHFDQYLKWKTHIDYINSKICGTIYKFKQLSYFLSHKNLKIIYWVIDENVVSYDLIACKSTWKY